MWTLSGFSKSEAIFARSLFEPTPTLTVNPRAALISSLRAVATSTGSRSPHREVMSMKHSSMENCCSTGEYFRQMPMNPSEQRLYHSQSPWTRTRSGQVRSAIVTGVATLTPSFFAGMDAAVTMLRRSDGSPDTTAGTSRRSCPPSATSFTADQLRKAEFTSIWKMTRDTSKGVRTNACARS